MLNTFDEKIEYNPEGIYKGGYHRFDSVTGTVVGFNACGCYMVEDKTGEEFFYYGNGTKGDRVQIGVKKINKETGRITWVLESVLEFAEIGSFDSREVA